MSHHPAPAPEAPESGASVVEEPARPPQQRSRRSLTKITILFPTDLWESLDEAADARGLSSRSDVIRLAVTGFLAPKAQP